MHVVLWNGSRGRLTCRIGDKTAQNIGGYLDMDCFLIGRNACHIFSSHPYSEVYDQQKRQRRDSYTERHR